MKRKNILIALGASATAAIIVGLLIRRTGLLKTMTHKIKRLGDTIDEQISSKTNGLRDLAHQSENRNSGRTY
jgi:hypothetical protein